MRRPEPPRALTRRRLRRLQARLLLWFLGAIVLAIAASIFVTVLTADDQETPTRVVSGHVQRRLAAIWDDPRATDQYVAQLKETTGLDMKVRRDPSLVANRRGRNGGLVFEDGATYVPIVRNGVVLGALELRNATPAPRPWRVFVALGAAVLVLGGVARRVSMRLARPLEHLASTAERFGGGDLEARVGVDRLGKRWVADEVRDVARAFDGMADRISRVVTEQRELLGAISHELRSPLGRARVALEIARERTESDPSTARSLSEVDKQLVEVDAILGDLLASARAGLGDLRRESVDLAAWARTRLEGEDLGKVELDARVSPKVSIDPALFGRALHNLLANAWAHGHPKDVPLVVRVTEEGGDAIVTVRDRGPGFPPELLPRAFEPFVTGGSSARSPGQGIGLGLTLVRRIVEAHAGRATARNVDGGGAEVELRIPAGSPAENPTV